MDNFTDFLSKIQDENSMRNLKQQIIQIFSEEDCSHII